MGVEEHPFSGETNANTQNTWKGAFKIALLKQATADKIYERPSSIDKRLEQWTSLANILRTCKHFEFFEGMLKDYNKKIWDNLKRGLNKSQADTELAKIRQLCFDYL